MDDMLVKEMLKLPAFCFQSLRELILIKAKPKEPMPPMPCTCYSCSLYRPFTTFTAKPTHEWAKFSYLLYCKFFFNADCRLLVTKKTIRLSRILIDGQKQLLPRVL